jgi:phosphoribosyl-ATP pyrophosphohydrolase
VIDAVNGNTEAVVRESADLLYNLTVLWAAAGVKPEDVWREMARREDLLGIAEKLPKSAVQPIEKPEAKLPKAVPDKALAAKSLPAKSLAAKSLPAKSLPAKSLPAKSLNKPLAKAVAPSAVRRRIVALEGRSSHKRH